jgi:hypothetical protein
MGSESCFDSFANVLGDHLYIKAIEREGSFIAKTKEKEFIVDWEMDMEMERAAIFRDSRAYR